LINEKAYSEFVIKNRLFSPKDKLLLAVSGGVDSVVLCELCYLTGNDFVIAHCNFQLRGEESDRDENFVRTLGTKYNKEVLVKRFDTQGYSAEHKVSTQVAARELRYSWFYELLGASPNSELRTPDLLLTAHHADDNIETVLMNFFKGTGIAGLRGILPKQGKIIRPLLSFRKEELMAFAQENNLQWVEDSSNATDKYSRNYFRQQLIPLVQKIYPKADENMLDNIQRFTDTELLYQQAILQHKKKLLEIKGNEIHIPVLKLQKSEPLYSIVYEIIKEYNFTSHQTNDVIGLLSSESGKYVGSSTHRIIRNRAWLIIAPVATEQANTILIEEGTSSIQAPAFRLDFLKLNTPDLPTGQAGSRLPTTDSIARLDMKQISFPFSSVNGNPVTTSIPWE
jgi:tRNA(Ile)-lysidine synthase